MQESGQLQCSQSDGGADSTPTSSGLALGTERIPNHSKEGKASGESCNVRGRWRPVYVVIAGVDRLRSAGGRGPTTCSSFWSSQPTWGRQASVKAYCSEYDSHLGYSVGMHFYEQHSGRVVELDLKVEKDLPTDDGA